MWPFKKKEVSAPIKPIAPVPLKCESSQMTLEVKQIKVSIVTDRANHYFFLKDEVSLWPETLDLGPGRRTGFNEFGLTVEEYENLYLKSYKYLRSTNSAARKLKEYQYKVGTDLPMTFIDEKGMAYTVPGREVKLLRVVKETILETLTTETYTTIRE